MDKYHLKSSFIILLLLSGDIASNPGPVKFPCGICNKPVRKNQRGIQCEDCIMWHHIKCIDLLVNEYIINYRHPLIAGFENHAHCQILHIRFLKTQRSQTHPCWIISLCLKNPFPM